MALEFELGGSQIDGARDYQEDAFLITHLTDANGKPSALVVIADGMGGHAAGNVASNMAVQAFNKHVSANYPNDDLGTILKDAVNKANDSIKETVGETPALAGMGCTMVAGLLEDGKIIWASVGDSHLYLVRNRELTKKNADHSYGGFLDRMEADGTPVEPEPGLSRNMLMSAITGEEINEIDIPSEPFQLEAGDRIILCSDGLDTLSSGKIIQYSEWSDSPKECSDELMKAVEEANMPRQDNTTAVVVNVKDTDAVPAEPEPPEDNSSDEVLEATSEIPVESTLEAPAPEPVAAPEPPPPAPEPQITEESQYDEPGKSKTGLFIGIAAAVVILIAAGAYFTMSKKPAGSEGPAIADTEIADSTTDEIIDEETPDVIEEEVTSSDEEMDAEATETEPVEKTVAASSESGKSIQDALKSGGDGPVMVIIPAGKFDMGSTKQTGESPKHEVSIESIAVSKNEITIAEYAIFAKAAGKKLPDTKGLQENYPVFFVSWDDAYAYTKWLSKETGEKYRLLSESEWEYVASGGEKTPFWWGYDMKPGYAHCFLGCNQELNTSIPMKTGSFKANQFGLYDTSGNVAEWVHDCWHENYKGAPSDGSVWEGGDCTMRVARGGSFISPEQSLRTAYRDKYKSNASYEFIGIRVAREL